MKARMYPERTREEIGAVCYAVCWYTRRPEYAFKEDFDFSVGLEYHVVRYRKLDDALANACHSVSDFFGAPSVQKQVVTWLCREDGVASWEDEGEPIEVGPAS